MCVIRKRRKKTYHIKIWCSLYLICVVYLKRTSWVLLKPVDWLQNEGGASRITTDINPNLHLKTPSKLKTSQEVSQIWTKLFIYSKNLIETHTKKERISIEWWSDGLQQCSYTNTYESLYKMYFVCLYKT